MLTRIATYDAEHLPHRLNCPFSYQPSAMMLAVVDGVRKDIERRDDWREEVMRGKMFGVLVVRNNDGEVGYLKAYSGQIGGREDWDGWVPAVFDYLQTDGYFVTHENEISAINRRVAELEQSPRMAMAASRLVNAEKSAADRVEQYRRYVADQKAARNERRRNGEDEAVLVAESQYQKAELRRLKKAVETELMPLRDAVERMHREIATLRGERKRLSDALQTWLFEQFVMLNGRGESMTLNEIFAPTPQRVPPSGAGECCAPKLLQYAFSHGYTPVEMAEFWWGESPKGEIRRHMEFYPACQGKCKPILNFMLQGIDVEPNPFETSVNADLANAELPVIFRDEYVIAVNKPAGMLSVPGRNGAVSALDIIRNMLGEGREVYAVHRLDMQTSGVLLFALSHEAYVALQREFANRRTRKTYVAVVERPEVLPMDMVVGMKGTISLPLSADYINRPCQIVDYEHGKEAVTDYEVTAITDDGITLKLHPHHGRTHQLRVHCAHKDGLNMPIKGDDLYGHHADRLLLHAERLVIFNPLNQQTYTLSAEADDWNKGSEQPISG